MVKVILLYHRWCGVGDANAMCTFLASILSSLSSSSNEKGWGDNEDADLVSWEWLAQDMRK